MDAKRLEEIRELLRPDLVDAADEMELREAAQDLLAEVDLLGSEKAGLSHDWMIADDAACRMEAERNQVRKALAWAMKHVENVFALAGPSDGELSDLQAARDALGAAAVQPIVDVTRSTTQPMKPCGQAPACGEASGSRAYVDEREKGELCGRCGKRYLTVYRLPDILWEQARKAAGGVNLLCPICVSDLLPDLYWEADRGHFPGDPALATESGGEPEPVAWGSPEAESLVYGDEDDAVEAMLEEMDPPYPKTITVCGYARMWVGQADLDRLNVLENALEGLDETFGDPDDYSEPTEAMRQAERVFLEALRREYVPWACTEVCRKEIGVAAWLRDNRPEWLAEAGA